MTDQVRPAGSPRVEPETAALRDLRTVMLDFGLTLGRRMQLHSTDLSAIEHLAFARQPLGPGELAARLGISPAATTELVDRLERAGHVERRRDLADRRRVRLEPSQAAVQEVRKHLGSLISAFNDLAAGMPPTDRAAVLRYLTGATEIYKQWAGGEPSD
ncbi:MarR family winged helix-turn-helix transcriptional regulator [Couchioplanes azureus]|uniref:MarR family winged helix-turn-helix transcriptional regulator n=1 Tax=Couchioplanes caeruleus TaxID=56438 RepID=UPI0019AA7279|nr:MarR family winged helix-turn-helix transcriptional regulator [Couchioplanes caeruleus]GGQ85149.1 transcriptional regulator [Couchioplanes caeruleus subsp. azureus]